MAKIEFSNVKMYIAESNGDYTPIGPVEDFDCTYNDANDIPPNISLANLTESFEWVCNLSRDVIMTIIGLRGVVIKCCPNKRVAHLALHAKKARTRKKNFHRAIKILEEMESND